MELTIRLSESRDGAVVVDIHHTGHSFTDVVSMLEPALYEAIRECIRRGVLQKVRIYWDGATIDLPNKKGQGHGETTDNKKN